MNTALGGSRPPDLQGLGVGGTLKGSTMNIKLCKDGSSSFLCKFTPNQGPSLDPPPEYTYKYNVVLRSKEKDKKSNLSKPRKTNGYTYIVALTII